MQPMEIVHQFLSSQKSVTFGAAEIKFFSLEELESAQVGFVRDPDGNYLPDEEDGRRYHGWYAIGIDGIDDIVTVNLSKQGLPVFTVEPAEWHYCNVADSLVNFREILGKIREVAVGRENVDRIKTKPLSQREKSRALRFTRKRNGGGEYDYWDFFFDMAEDKE